MNKFRMVKAGINVNAGIERLCGDSEMYESLLAGYLEDTHYAQLKEALDNKSVEEAFQAAHALKGVVGNLSMDKLFQAMVPVVEVLRGGSLEVDDMMPAIEEANTKVIEAITDMVNK